MTTLTSPEQTSLQLTRRYPFSREKVFRAWTEPQAIKTWLAPSDDFQIPAAEMDLRVGGSYRIEMIAPDGKRHCVGGVYREVSAPSKLVFTWIWESAPANETLVTVELRDSGGETELTLTHEGFANGDVRASHLHGWTGTLERLDRVKV